MPFAERPQINKLNSRNSKMIIMLCSFLLGIITANACIKGFANE